MNYNQTLNYIKELRKLGSSFGLSTMEALLKYLGNPQDNMRVVHIAGTNGKGSVTSYITSILSKSGYKTGAYISPEIWDIRERVQIDGHYIREEELVHAIKIIKTTIEQMVNDGLRHPTEFEVMTALAFLYFQEKKCDFVVLETGLGGRYDATNVIKEPICCVITAIGLDHANILGYDIEKIAYEKAGIIKPGSDVILYQQDETIMDVIIKACHDNKANLQVTDFDKYSIIESSYKKQVFSYKDDTKMTIHLLGEHQIRNAITAIETAHAISRRGYHIHESDVTGGLLETRWPYRLEIISHEPLVVLDGAHNVQAAKALRESIEQYFGDKKIIYIFGVLRDKEYENILEITAPIADTVITITPNNERGLPSIQATEIARQYCNHVIDGNTIDDAVKISLEIAGNNHVIIGFGSLSYLGELKKTFNKLNIL